MAPTTSCFSSSSRSAFREKYLQRLLPLLSCIHSRTTTQRFLAVKKAADLSLAFTAGNTSWSRALYRKLSGYYGRCRKQKISRRNSIARTAAHQGGEAFLKRLKRRRFLGRRQQALNYRKSFSRVIHAQRRESSCKYVTQKGKIEAAQSEAASLNQDTKKPKVTRYGNSEGDKLSSLSELIPGGHQMDLPKLLDQAAHYIFSLQLQVDALTHLGQALST